jgi:hypothetical protein
MMKRQTKDGLIFNKLLASVAFLSILGCRHPQLIGMHQPDLSHCNRIESAIDLHDRISTLNNLSHAFYDRCDETVIKFGTKVQTEYRYKTYSVLKETGSIFIPDGTLTDYILESYERGFLSFLLSTSYYRSQNAEEAAVELRRLDHEIFTPLYNYGEDPVNILLSAVLWEKLGERSESRVDWNRLQGPTELNKQTGQPIRSFASKRIEQIDSAENIRSDWTIYTFGRFPDINWNIKFINSEDGYFSVTTQQDFIPDCASDTGLRISTQSWFHKIAMRHNNSYHPLLNVQSWIRLPFGLVYSIIPLATGAGISIGGCAADAYAHGNGYLCRASVKGGVAVMKESPKVLKGTVHPDLRHWEYLPSGFIVTTADDPDQEKCYTNLPDDMKKRETFRILD